MNSLGVFEQWTHGEKCSAQSRLRRETVHAAGQKCSANCSAGPMAQNQTAGAGGDGGAINEKRPWFQGLFHALEWTRTTTDHTVHKALNLARLPIPPRAQSGRV